jgi:hypothetical protein
MNSGSVSRKWVYGRLVNRGSTSITVALIAIMLVSSGSLQVPVVSGHVPGDTFQGWAPAPPSIDGDIGTTEWQTAASSSFTMMIGGNSYAGTLYVMNDATNLYLAVKMADSTFSTDPTPDGVAFYFDNNNNGVFEPGDDGLGYITGATGFLDRFLEVIPTMQKDVDFGGTTDGSGAAAAHGGFNHFELSHPLNSADDAHDFSLTALNTVGFTMLYLDGPVGQAYWPALATEDATGWGDIVIASAPPTMTAWAPVAPTIDGVVGAAEWASASHAPFSIGWTFVGDLWVMNDANNLYLAVKIADTSLTVMDRIYFGFDNNNDGTRAAGDDILGVMGDGTFMDLFWGPTTKFDNTEGGTSDGLGSSSGSGGFNYFEISHPLDSADDAHDFSLSAGSTVGFHLEYWEEASGYWGDWPALNAKDWAHITVASAPAPTPDFSIACAPTPVSVAQGGSGSSICTVTSLNGFSLAVDLSGSWVGTAPSGVVPALPSPITPPSGGTATSTLTIAASSGASTGAFTFRVTGTSGALCHTTDVAVEITAAGADFTIALSPSSLSLSPGTSGTSTVTVQSIGVFSGPVALSSSGAPSGLNLVFGTTPVTPPAGGTASSTLTVTVSGAPAGSYSITIAGTSDSTTTGASLSVEILAAGGHCLIATATYGSELSDEVQFLRDFRDNSILRTRTGSDFMIVFNAWYYSFSPFVAEFIRGDSLARTLAKLILYPLIGILRIGSGVFYIFPSNLEAGAVTSGLLVSSLIGMIYASTPLAAVLARVPRARRAARRLEMPAFGILFGALASVAFITAVGAPPIPMMVATATIVLATLIVSALCTSRAILALARHI